MKRVLFFAFLGFLAAACSGSDANHAKHPPVTKLGEPTGDVDPAVIGDAVRGHSGRFQRCYEEARQRNPSLQGQIEVRFAINSDGTVAQAMAAESNLPPQVTECVVNTFYDLHLPEQRGAAIAQYPMFFQPS